MWAEGFVVVMIIIGIINIISRTRREILVLTKTLYFSLTYLLYEFRIVLE
jgi:hypothetical protein